MSHPPLYLSRMNSSFMPASSRRKTSRSSRSTKSEMVQPELGWIHDGVRHRVTLWPEVRFLREAGLEQWTDAGASEDSFASAALGVTPSQWRRYLEFVPAAERDFVELFQFSRVAALQVITRCPTLLPVLKEFPALTAFLTAHVSLRGGEEPRWAEIAAVFE